MPGADAWRMLRDLFDRLARRPAPWRRDRPLPQLSVFLAGPGGDDDLEPIIAPGGRELPFVSLGPAEVTDVRSTVEKAARRLGQRTGPVGLPRIRFQLTAFVLLVMESRDSGNVSIPDLEQALAAHRPGRRGPNHDRPLVIWLDYLSRLLTGWIPAASAVAAVLGTVTTLLGWLLAVASGIVVAAGHAVLLARTHVRSSWFRGHRFLPRDPWERLSSYAGRLATHAPAEDLELLLVGAFLEDLRQAYKRRRLFLWPSWARAYHCALYLRNVRAPVPFLKRLHTVREGVARWDPLLVVTSGPPVPELIPPVRTLRVGPDHDGYRAWSHQVSHRYGPTYLVAEGVDLTGPAPVLPPPPARGHKRVRAYWSVLAALLVVPLVASGAFVWHTATTYCQSFDVLRDGDECIGISYSGAAFAERLARPLGIIAAQNKKAVASGRWVEIAYIGPMTGRPGALLAGSEGELYGIAAYQKHHNETLVRPVKLRILLANPGRAFRKSQQVARQVVGRLEQGAPLVGVLGMAQSREGNKKAILTLNAAGLPVLVTVATADDLGGRKVDPAGSGANPAGSEDDPAGSEGTAPYFFRMAANNMRQAQAAAAWIRAGTGGLPRATTVAVLVDKTEGDLYSRGLAADFAKVFKPESVHLLEYSGTQQLGERVRGTCERELIFYTGRGVDFASFLDTLVKDCGPTGTPHVLASDDVTSFVQDNLDKLGGNPRLHYMPLAWEGVWAKSDPRLLQINDMIGERSPESEEKEKTQPSKSHAMLAYDATLALSEAIKNAAGAGRALPDKGTVLYELSIMRRIYGTTGAIEFTPGRGPYESVGKLIMLVQVMPAKQDLVGLCGTISEGAKQQETSCPDAGLRPPE